MTTLSFRTQKREQLLDITAEVDALVRKSGVRDGICFVWSLHTTCGVTVNENADPDVGHDLAAKMAQLVPRDDPLYRHTEEGNADAHIKTSLVGTCATLPVSDGKLLLGTWQGVFLAEFDGPRTRRLAVTVLPVPGPAPR
ncbi:MAG: YjbQ family protein [Gemmatimonadetes bacterium]|nr:YjbQ family protein [Gemmatimonadota bacterium]